MILNNLSRYRSSSAYKQSLFVNIMSKKKFFLKYLATCRTKLVPKLIWYFECADLDINVKKNFMKLGNI